MINEAGQIIEVLPDKYVLIRATEELTPNRIVKVYGRIPSSILSTKYGLPYIEVPKGELRILQKQGEKLYLAESFRSLVERSRQVLTATNFLSGMIGSPTFEKEYVEGPLSAALAPPSIKLEITDRVQIGDVIAND